MSTLSKYVFDPLKLAISKALGADGGQDATANLTQAQNLVNGAIQTLVNKAVATVIALIPAGFADLEAEFLDDVIAGLQAARAALPPSSIGVSK